MNLNLTAPPQNDPDDPYVWIWFGDPAWDRDRITAERQRLRDAAAPEPEPLPPDATLDQARAWRDQHKPTLDARTEAANAHPVPRWAGCESMFSLQAELTVPELLRGDGPAAVLISHYWRAEPTRFHLKLLTMAEDRACDRYASGPRWYVEIIRRGLLFVEQTVDGDTVRVEPPRDAAGLIQEQWIDRIDIRYPGLTDALAVDIMNLRRRAGELGKP